ncbi:MAG: 2-dehydropantoate 2-reductase [Sedimentisphaerales bacterium]|nr:2-dehydropantoate 2-reductase [Sedimentisphaerales bacterium]
MSAELTILVYGAGAVGLGLASCLLRAGMSVDLITRETTVQALQQKGLDRTGIFGDFHADSTQFGSYACLDELPSRKYDYILVCVKSFASSNAAKDLAKQEYILLGKPIIVLCQNGWGNAEAFAKQFAELRIYNARIITGFERPTPHSVVITVHADAIHIGSLYSTNPSQVEALSKAIDTGGIPCQTTNEIGKDLWTKMLYNCALNPLGAILDCPYGVLADNKSTRFLMDCIVHEIFAVMGASGYQTFFQKPHTFLDTFYGKLVPATAEHRSSTLQDIKAGRRTEIDALNGAVITLGQKHRIDVPYNQSVYRIVKFLETGAGCD